jgi:hypothetical protein
MYAFENFHKERKIDETVQFFSVKADAIAIDEESLFDEISSLKAFVTKEKIRNGTWKMLILVQGGVKCFYTFLRKWFLICNYKGWLKYLCASQEVMVLWREFSLQ